jgi:hypothetical protein
MPHLGRHKGAHHCGKWHLVAEALIKWIHLMLPILSVEGKFRGQASQLELINTEDTIFGLASESPSKEQLRPSQCHFHPTLIRCYLFHPY